MTQEEKQLLLVDLCARLPYGVKIEYIKTKKQYRLHELSEDGDYFDMYSEKEDYPTYEDACEAAIRYCLENLI